MTLHECTSTREIPDEAQAIQIGKKDSIAEVIKKYKEKHRVEIEKVCHRLHWLYFVEKK